MMNFDDLGILIAFGISHQLLNINYSLSLRMSVIFEIQSLCELSLQKSNL